MCLTEMKRQLSKEENKNGKRCSFILLHDVPEQLKCRLCEQLLKDPIQTIRGELSCEDCYVIRDGICPIDREPIATGQWFKDNFKLMEINQLPCYCPNKDNGCEWIGKVCDAKEHSTECAYEPAKCIICHETILNEDSQEEHLEQCKVIAKEKKCPFYTLGCSFKIREDGKILSHLQSNHWQHFLALMQTVGNLFSESQSNDEQVQIVVQKLASDKESLEKILGEREKEVNSLKDELQNTQESVFNLQEQLKIIKSGETSTKNMEMQPNKVNTKNMDEKLSEISLRQKLLENTSYDGQIIWKIDNFSHRMQQAVKGEVTALHSAPCFTSKYGYKFCGRLYLNGDGMGKCTHLSLFIVLMKSEYDNLLEWPFMKKVTLRLINQDDSTRSVEESFVGDRFSSCFQKPSKEMNVASGCPALIPKDELLTGGFVKDDSMFIEISVF